MKVTHKGKRYDTDKCKDCGEKDHYSYSNNYAGTTTLFLASDGTCILHTDANGQDFHVQDGIWVVERCEAIEWLNGADQDADQEANAIAAGLIEIVG